MIEGTGDIAKVLRDREGFTFFARGVSNSQETDEFQYQREKNMLALQPKRDRLVYFGSLSIFYADNRYTRHKLEMEELVRETFPKWTIVRLGNITFGNNPHTIVNFFRNKIASGEHFEVRDECRYLTDKEELLHWINLIPNFNCEMNITGRRVHVAQIVEEIKSGKL